MTTACAGDQDPPSHALEDAAAAFAMLSSSVRLHIVWALAQQDSGVSQLARRIGNTPQAVSQHLAKLKLAGMVRVRREGRTHVYSVTDRSLQAAATLMIERFAPRHETQPIGHTLSA